MPVVSPPRKTQSPYADERVLVDGLRKGDEAAFSWLFDRYDGALRRLARTYVSTAASADEVVGETWLAVIEGIDRFEGRSSVSTWIYRILANIARSRGVREQRSIPFSSAAGALDDGDGPVVDPEPLPAPRRGGRRELGRATGRLGRRTGGAPHLPGDPRRRPGGHRSAPAGAARGDHATRHRGLDGRGSA